MEIIQKRFSTQINFSFAEEMLNYAIRTSGGNRSFSVHYGHLPYENLGGITEKNDWYRNVGILWSAIGLLQVWARFTETGTLAGSLWLTLGIGCFLIYHFSKRSYTLLKSKAGTVLVLHDAQHEGILEEIGRRQKAQWAAWFGIVNERGNPQEELARFNWLRERGAITDSELEAAKSQIFQAFREASPEPKQLALH